MMKSLFQSTKTKPEKMSDSEIEAEATRTQPVLRERTKRREQRRQADELEALAMQAKKQKADLAARMKERATIHEEATKANAEFSAAIIAAGAALEQREKCCRDIWSVDAALQGLGTTPPPLPVPTFTTGAAEAAHRIGPALTEILNATSPLNHPALFRFG